jgi:hypothetical protein
MGRQTTSRILMSGTFLVSVMIGPDVMAQGVAHPSTNGTSQQTQSSKGVQNHAAAEHNPACQRIISECKNLGFIQEQSKEDNGLWRDCFDPVVKSGAMPPGKESPSAFRSAQATFRPAAHPKPIISRDRSVRFERV